MRGGFRVVTSHLEQVPADGVQTVIASDPRIIIQFIKQLERGSRAFYHSSSNGVVQRDHWVVRDGFEQIVKGKDLWPVGILGARGFVVHCGDGSLQLVK